MTVLVCDGRVRREFDIIVCFERITSGKRFHPDMVRFSKTKLIAPSVVSIRSILEDANTHIRAGFNCGGCGSRRAECRT